MELSEKVKSARLAECTHKDWHLAIIGTEEAAARWATWSARRTAGRSFLAS